MRVPALFLSVFFAFNLNAQDQKDPYYLQQAPMQQMPLDCYQHHVDEGIAAQKRGDCRLALRWFRDAKSCPEAIKIPGRMEELNQLIAACENQKNKTGAAQKEVSPVSTTPDLAPVAGTVGSEARRRFLPSREFLTYDKPECFDITCKEAERAFRGGHWDDAAALYRAAKNCADADQADRQAANLRIEACKTASQNELRRKEQEAVRQARHALAANRANDASQLLRAFDRSLAYRLADFANEYIAPEDNDACRQAMFDALYYAPSVHSGLADDKLSIPFCYQLGDNLDRELQVHYLGVSGNRKICAFARSRHLLFQWDAETFVPEEPLGMEDTTLLFCDAVPDNRTLLFLSKNVYLFWRNPRETFRLPVQNVSQYCFDEKGYAFYYLNPTEMQIYALPLRDIFAQRKGGSRATPQPTGLQLGEGVLLRLANAKGRLWAGYRDSIVVFAPGAERGSWQREQVLLIAKPVRNYYTGDLPYLLLKPAAGGAVFFNDSAAHYFKLPAAAGYETLEPYAVLAGFPVAVSQDARLAATYFIGTASDKDSRLYVYDTEGGALRYAALIPASHPDMHLKTGVFSPDNRQFATTTGGGRLEVWTLDEGSNQRIKPLGRNAFFALNADGTKLFAWRSDSLMLMSADDPRQIQRVAPAPADADPGLVAGQNWLAYRTGFDSLALTDRLGQPRYQIPSPPGYNGEVAAAFNTAESKIACLAGTDSIAVWSLHDGRLLAARAFGGAIHQLYFVPQTDEIMAVQQVEAEDFGNEQTVIKIWNPAYDLGAKLQTVRLHDYATLEVAFSAAGGLMAFTDGLDIRIFHRNDLLNETVRIRQYGLRMVTALAFHPEGGVLAAGYDDGSVVFWDIGTGQARFKWAKPPIRENEDFPPVIRLRFTDGGRRLQMLLFGYVLLTRDVALSLVRAGVQTDYRKLISFLPNQIREYNLEQALDYPNNFTRLANSGDLPLIRSFFDYYRESAIYSNNIQRVSNYCNRALVLFGQLDAGAQNVLRPILLEMYEDYHWKLLLRGQTGAAEQVANTMLRDFESPLSATLAAANSALLRNDQRTAARHYADWALRTAEQGGNNGVMPQSALDSLHTRLRQLLEYDLLKPNQLECICDLFGFFPSYHTLCESTPAETALSELDPTTRLQWDNFRRLNKSVWIKNNPEKVQLLEKAMDNVRLLQRQNKSVYRRELEKVTLALQQAFLGWAVFEQGNTRSLNLYKKAIEGLNVPAPFESPAREIIRLARLSEYYLYYGSALLDADKSADALPTLKLGLQVADRLLQLIGADSSRYNWYRNELHAKLYTQIGLAQLLEGDAAAAEQAFEAARSASTQGINDLYFGHAALLKGDDVEALLNYGDLYNEEILGETLLHIHRMARRLPTQRDRLTAFSNRLYQARVVANRQLDTEVAQYYLAEQKREYFSNLELWDSTLQWNMTALDYATRLLNRDTTSTFWQSRYLDVLLNQTFYLLFQKNDTSRFSDVIRYEQMSERFPDQAGFYYENRYLFYTNLAHAYWLRQKPGDQELALQYYRAFLRNDLNQNDPWELLLKDFRDLAHAGVKWPDLAGLIRQVRPPGALSAPEDWEELGVKPPLER